MFEQWRTRDWVVAVLAIMAGVGLVALLVASRRPGELTVDDSAVAKAKAEFDRNQRVLEAPAIAPPTYSLPKTTPKPAAVEKTESVSTELNERKIFKGTRPFGRKQPAAIKGEKSDLVRMDEANKFFDRQNYDEAQRVALELLEKNPSNVRMLRVMVSSACIMGNEDQAKTHYERLPERDQRQMAVRCERYGIEL